MCVHSYVCLHVCLSERVHLNFPSITSYYPGDKSPGQTEPLPILAALGPNAHASFSLSGYTGIWSGKLDRWRAKIWYHLKDRELNWSKEACRIIIHTIIAFNRSMFNCISRSCLDHKLFIWVEHDSFFFSISLFVIQKEPIVLELQLKQL